VVKNIIDKGTRKIYKQNFPYCAWWGQQPPQRPVAGGTTGHFSIQ